MSSYAASTQDSLYYLYMPQSLFQKFGFLEKFLLRAPFGGQYAVVGRAAR